MYDDSWIRKGMRVKRGPTWDYGNQDGGAGNFGTVVGARRDSWWRVEWDCGNANQYRVGKIFQDIIFLDDKELQELREKEEAGNACSCGGLSKKIEVMNMVIAVCVDCNKRK